MSATSTLPYGEVIKDYRLLLGIEPERIATITNVQPSDILNLENGNTPSPAFCQRFLQRTGCINLFVQSVLQAAEVGSSTEELEKLIAPVIESLKAKPEVAEVLWRAITAPVEAQATLTESLQTSATIQEQNPDKGADFSANSTTQEAQPVRIHYDHTMPEHGSHIVDEGKWGEKQHDHLITLKQAAALYPNEVSYGDVLRWHYSGLLEEQGRRWLARPGGRSIPLVSQVEVAYLKDNRPPRGPIESFKKKMRIDIDRLRRSRRQTEILPDEELAEQKLITLKEAVETHGVAYETLRSWYRSGHLPERGREVFPTHGGGKILVDEQDVVRLKSQPPRRGKPPIKST
jgi:transcriptional regulator with XRE-family HTH domain